MKPIKNVFAACDGSKKGYSVNGSESTLMLVGQKWDEDKAPVMSAILNHFDFFPKTHIVLLEIVALGNWKSNRNIKANDVNLLSMARSIDFFFKRTYIGMFLCFGSIIRCFQCFGTWSVNLWKIDSHEPPYPSEITVFEPPPSASEFSMIFPGGAVWKFSGTTPCMAWMALRLALCPVSSILFCLGNKIVFADHRGFLSRAGVPFILQSEEETLSLL